MGFWTLILLAAAIVVANVLEVNTGVVLPKVEEARRSGEEEDAATREGARREEGTLAAAVENVLAATLADVVI